MQKLDPEGPRKQRQTAAHEIGGSVEFGCVIVMSVFNLLTFNYGEGAAAAAAV